MSFSRDPNRLPSPQNYNPPPNYYITPSALAAPSRSFGKDRRFVPPALATTPGPGSYYSVKTTVKPAVVAPTPVSDSNIKISSIPSIPNKSATRVYEELAPGILILHQEEYHNANVGPGSYEVPTNFTTKAFTIPPPKKPQKPKQEEESFTRGVSVVEEIRKEKRLVNQQSVIKKSNVNKGEINSSDMCLEVIILREKLLRGDDNPPPGHYYTEKQSCFHKEPQKSSEFQRLQGKEERFKEYQKCEVGPGSYNRQEEIRPSGGYIPRQVRNQVQKSIIIGTFDAKQVSTTNIPGPGTYKLQIQPKALNQTQPEYPSIFGSGSVRFDLNRSILQPGPGSYNLTNPRRKRRREVKVRKEMLTTTKEERFAFNDPPPRQRTFKSHQRNDHFFASKVDRFLGQSLESNVGPGQYQSESKKKGFNKGAFVGAKQCRFVNYLTRPEVGPGTYSASIDPVKVKKIINVIL